jgi:NADPH:quinone reductase-like Zn-dependent oxidoreductase
MRAVRFAAFGGPEVLRLEEVPEPHAGAGQVLVRVVATAFNPLDATLRSGVLQPVFDLPLPHVPGIDVAGTVAAVGGGVDGLAPGDDVVGFLPLLADGASAELVVAPAEVLTAAPTSVPLADAAALPSAGLSAWQSLFELAGLEAGQRLLVNGAGGGVGGFAVQLAKEAGATVVATASPRSTAAVRAAGADEVVDYTRTAVVDAVSEPVDAVLHLVPSTPEDVAALVALIRPGGIVVSTTGPVAGDPGRGVRSANLFVRSDRDQLAGLVERVDAGRLRLDVGARIGLADLGDVHERSAAGALRGRVVVTVGAA